MNLAPVTATPPPSAYPPAPPGPGDTYVPKVPVRGWKDTVVDLSDLDRAATAWRESLVTEIPSRMALRDLAFVTRRLMDQVEDILPSWPKPTDAPKIEESRRIFQRVVGTLSDISGQWTMEPEDTKDFPKFQAALRGLARALPSTDLDDWRYGGAVGNARTYLAVAAFDLAMATTYQQVPRLNGTAARAAGLARAAEDASYRIGHAISDSKNYRHFSGSATRMARIGVDQLRSVLREGADLLPAATADALRGATDALAATFPQDRVVFDATYVDFVRLAEAAADRARDAAAALDTRRASLPAQPNPEELAQWRTRPLGASTPWYHDFDFGPHGTPYQPEWPPSPIDARPKPPRVDP